MISNGNSFSGGERRNTEPSIWRMQGGVQPGAVS